MRWLWLLLVALLAGAGFFFFALSSDGGRGRTPRPSDPHLESPAAPAPTPQAPLAETSHQNTRRQSIPAAAPPPVRAVFEGTIVGEGAPLAGAQVEIVQRGQALAAAIADAQGKVHLELAPLTAAATLRVAARGFVPLERALVGRPSGGTVLLGNVRLLRGQRIEGRVIDERRAGIVDAELRVEPASPLGDQLVARARSGPNGQFAVNDCPPGAVLVSARAKGFGEQTLPFQPGSKPLEIQLAPGVSLQLLLRAPDGQPIADAEVVIQAANDPRAVKRQDLTDGEGRVTFDGLAARLWSVRISHPEYRTNGRSQVTATGREEVIECIPWPAISGTVRAPDGSPPPSGTRVQALPAQAPNDRVTGFEGGELVAADGSFRLGGLRAGDWRIRATAPGFAPTLSNPIKLGIEGDGYAGLIQLLAGGKVALDLKLDGKPLAGAELEVFLTAPSRPQLWAYATARAAQPRVVSDERGHAEFANLTMGSVWVAIYAEGCPPQPAGPLTVSADATPLPLEVALTRGGRMQGRVQSKAGAPMAFAQLRIVERDGQLGFPLTLASGEDGRYATAWLPPGHYTVQAFNPEASDRLSGTEELELAAGEVRVLDFQL